MNIRFKTMATLVVLNALWTGGSSAQTSYDIDYTDVALNIGGGNQLFHTYSQSENHATRDSQAWKSDLGTVSSLVLNGGFLEAYVNNGAMPADLSASLYYCVYPQNSTVNLNSFTSMALSPAGVGTSYQQWQHADAGINLLNGLAAGNYTLGIYFKTFEGSLPTNSDPWEGGTYIANFSLVTPVPEPTEVALPLFGALCVAGAAVRRFGWWSKRSA